MWREQKGMTRTALLADRKLSRSADAAAQLHGQTQKKPRGKNKKKQIERRRKKREWDRVEEVSDTGWFVGVWIKILCNGGRSPFTPRN